MEGCATVILTLCIYSDLIIFRTFAFCIHVNIQITRSMSFLHCVKEVSLQLKFHSGKEDEVAVVCVVNCVLVSRYLRMLTVWSPLNEFLVHSLVNVENETSKNLHRLTSRECMNVQRNILLICVCNIQQISSDWSLWGISAEVQHHHAQHSKNDADSMLIGSVADGKAWREYHKIYTDRICWTAFFMIC